MRKTIAFLACAATTASLLTTTAFAEPVHHGAPGKVQHHAKRHHHSSHERYTVLQGEASFMQRIMLSPHAKLHVSLVGRVAGAEYLPLATTVMKAQSGITRFKLNVPSGIPAGRYRVQAWIIDDNRLMFDGKNPQTEVSSLHVPVKIPLKMVAAPRDIDGIGTGTGGKIDRPLTTRKPDVYGTVTKLDKRGMAEDAEVEVQLLDISLADAPARVLATQRFKLNGKQLPARFALNGEEALDPKLRYSLSARVYEGGKLSYITDTVNMVGTENAEEPFELLVRPVRR